MVADFETNKVNTPYEVWNSVYKNDVPLHYFKDIYRDSSSIIFIKPLQTICVRNTENLTKK